jgi:hypothetical protein
VIVLDSACKDCPKGCTKNEGRGISVEFRLHENDVALKSADKILNPGPGGLGGHSGETSRTKRVKSWNSVGTKIHVSRVRPNA